MRNRSDVPGLAELFLEGFERGFRVADGDNVRAGIDRLRDFFAVRRLYHRFNRLADHFVSHLRSRHGQLAAGNGFARRPVRTPQVWGFMDSQEAAGVSPGMFEEIVWPAYECLGRTFGLLSYGCCGPLGPVWDFISQFPNLRKASVSPWANEEKMGEYLRGTRTIYQRTPGPNFLGVDETLDEDAWREHIGHPLRCAQGCKLEFTSRDVYTIHNNLGKVARAVEIIRASIGRLWQA